MRRTLFVSLSLALAASPGTAIRAQVELLPPDQPADQRSTPSETVVPVPQPAQPGTSQTPAEPGMDTEPTVRIGDLPAISADAIGTLDQDKGGFGPDLWQGSDRARIVKLITRLPVGAPSPAMRALVRRLMLSAAAPAPAGQAGSGDWLELRLATLLGIGDWEAVGELGALIPEASKSARMAEIETDARLLAGDNPAACAIVRESLRGQAALYWRAALPFCQVLAGETAPAALSRDLLRAEEASLAPGTMALLALVLKESDALDGSVEIAPRPFLAALLVAAQAPAPDSWWQAAGPEVMRALARADKLDAKTRLAAGERAAAQGSLAPDDLARLYLSMKFNPEELADAAAAATERGGTVGRALLVQASAQSLPAEQRARLLTAAWREAGSQPGFPALARVTIDSVAQILPDTTLIWFAGDAARASIAAGRNDLADRWLGLLSSGAGVDAAAAAAAAAGMDRIAPLAVTALPDGGLPWQAAMIERYWRALPRDDGGDSALHMKRAERLFVTLDALGRDIGAGWDLLVDGPLYSATRIPSEGLRYALRNAAQAKRLGETAVLALLALGPAGPAGADPLALGAALRTLRAVGLASDARSLALEAMLADG